MPGVLRVAASLLAAPTGVLAAVSGNSGSAGAAAGVATVPGGGLSPEQAASYATGLLVVFVLLAAMFWFAKRMQGRHGIAGGALRVRSCLPLGGKERLMVVDAEGQRLLIGVSPGGVTLIRELGDEAPPKAMQTGWLTRTLGSQVPS